MQLIFDRVVTKKTPGEFRTRVIQEGVHPSLHIPYKDLDLKQYFKEGRGCRTEGTFRNPHDCGIICPTGARSAGRSTGACWKSRV